MRDVCDFCPFPDEHTRDLLDDAVDALGILRGFHNLTHDDCPYDSHHRAFRDDPALRLHLLVSLQHELHAELLHAVIAAHDPGYTPGQIAVLLDHSA
jgi:hypothetical protein